MKNSELSDRLKEKMKQLQADTIREDGRLERHCKHGIGHTVGHVNHAMIYDKHFDVHGCDGCCSGWEREK